MNEQELDLLEFPFSDHIPIVSKFRLKCGKIIKIGSFNILAKKYLLKHSESVITNQKLEHLVDMELCDIGKKSTRIEGIVKQIINILKLGILVLGIQEASVEFIKYLGASEIYSDYNIIGTDIIDGGQIIIYNKKKLKFIREKYCETSYPHHNYKIMDTIFEYIEHQEQFRFINTHTPFNKIEYFLKYLLNIGTPTESTIIVGDLNTEPDKIKDIVKRKYQINIHGLTLQWMLVNIVDIDGKIKTINYTHKNLSANRVIIDHILFLS